MKFNKISRDVIRKFLHLIIGTILLALLYYKILNAFKLFILLIIAGIFSLLLKYIKVPFLSWLVGNFGKRNERKFPGRGFILMMIGFLLAIKLFPQPIAYASISISVFWDAFNQLFTYLIPFGRLKIKKPKTIFGVLFGFVITAFITRLFVSWKFVIVGLIAAVFFEIFEFKVEGQVLDDNVMIPLVSGTAMLILMYNM